MIRAENLTISVPGNVCNKNCPYCISKITGFTTFNNKLWYRNFEKVMNIAGMSQITNIMLTGKGEPLMYGKLSYIKFIMSKFKKWPLEIQSNGRIFLNSNNDAKNSSIKKMLYENGLDIFALSVDFFEMTSETNTIHSFFKYLQDKIFNEFAHLGITIRVTINITNHEIFSNFIPDSNFFKMLKECKIDQVTFRNIVKPTYVKNKNKIIEWIDNNSTGEYYNKIIGYIKDTYINKAELIRKTINNTYIYDIEGVSFMYSDYCIQESATDDNIRSLIYDVDGHLYTSWNSKASRLF